MQGVLQKMEKVCRRIYEKFVYCMVDVTFMHNTTLVIYPLFGNIMWNMASFIKHCRARNGGEPYMTTRTRNCCYY